MYTPLTPQQLANKNDAQMKKLQSKGYVWDKKLSVSYAGVVLRLGTDLYIFDMEGNVHHNPETITINC